MKKERKSVYIAPFIYYVYLKALSICQMNNDTEIYIDFWVIRASQVLCMLQRDRQSLDHRIGYTLSQSINIMYKVLFLKHISKVLLSDLST